MSDITYYVKNSSNKDLVHYYEIMKRSLTTNIDRVDLLTKYALLAVAKNEWHTIDSFIDNLESARNDVIKYAAYVGEISEEIDRRDINEEVFD